MSMRGACGSSTSTPTGSPIPRRRWRPACSTIVRLAGITVIEWADRLDGLLPEDRLELTLEPDPEVEERRRVRWRASGSAHTRLASAALAGR